VFTFVLRKVSVIRWKLGLFGYGLLWLMVVSPSVGQQSPAVLEITVQMAGTGEAISSAEVYLVGSRRGRLTDSRGISRLSALDPGTDTLVVRHARFATLRLPMVFSPGETIRLLVELEMRPVEIAGVTVRERARPRSAQLRGFYERAERRIVGYFITRKDIDRQQGAKFSDALRGIPNLHLVRLENGLYMPRFNRAMASLTDGDCPIKYYLDGIEVPGSPANPDFQFQMKEIEGIEVYSGTNLPAQFGGSRAACGVIAIWTREDA
jgi:hypothetical protein